MSKSVTSVDSVLSVFNQLGTMQTPNVGISTDSFSSVMERTTNHDTSLGQSDYTAVDSGSTDAQEHANALKDNSRAAEKVESCTKPEQKEISSQEAQTAKDAVEDTAGEVVEKVADTMSVTEEEVVQAMEMLGMTAVDLLDKTNLAQLMLQLSGESDSMALVTNETLYNGMQEILQFISNELASVQEMLGLDDAQFDSYMDLFRLDGMQSVVQSTELVDQSNQAEQMEQLPVFDMRAEQNGEMAVADAPAEEAVVTVTKNGQEVQVVVETDANTGVSTITQETKPLNDMMGDGRGEEHAKNNNTPAEGGNVLLQNASQQQNTTSVTPQTEIPFTEPEIRDIFNQITEFMRVQVKADTTSLQMQLHPESLGTLNIHIAAKNGILTAQFTAQNEAIKNVIEGQLITLQQNLNEQGIKVEAVEVNVATQEFNRNLDQGQNGNEEASKEAKKKNARKINLNALESLDDLEELDEEDKVTADMMARNGNTVDYLA